MNGWISTNYIRDRGAAGSSLTSPWARHIYPSLVLVQPRKRRPCLSERLLMGRKQKKSTNYIYLLFVTKLRLGYLAIHVPSFKVNLSWTVLDGEQGGGSVPILWKLTSGYIGVLRKHTGTDPLGVKQLGLLGPIASRGRFVRPSADLWNALTKNVRTPPPHSWRKFLDPPIPLVLELSLTCLSKPRNYSGGSVGSLEPPTLPPF